MLHVQISSLGETVTMLLKVNAEMEESFFSPRDCGKASSK